MAGVEKKRLDSPDETRTPDKTTIAVVNVGNATIARATLEPGWKWSEQIKPIAGTDDCQARHLGIVESGTLHIVHSDGSEGDLGPGDVYHIEPGHDGWVVGDQPFVGVEFDQTAAASFGK